MCIVEVKEVHRPWTHFTKLGWKKSVKNKFYTNEEIGKDINELESQEENILTMEQKNEKWILRNNIVKSIMTKWYYMTIYYLFSF